MSIRAELKKQVAVGTWKRRVSLSNVRKRVAGAKSGFGEERRVRVVRAEEVHPEVVVGDKGSPRLAEEAESGGVFGAQESHDLHEYVGGERVEGAQRRRRAFR